MNSACPLRPKAGMAEHNSEHYLSVLIEKVSIRNRIQIQIGIHVKMDRPIYYKGSTLVGYWYSIQQSQRTLSLAQWQVLALV